MKDKSQPTVMVWTDHPDSTTGFANASRPFIDLMMDMGWNVPVLGRMGYGMKESKYDIRHVSQHDLDGVGNLIPHMLQDKPDLLWIIGSPGLVNRWLDLPAHGLRYVKEAMRPGGKFGDWTFPKVMVYCPIEGRPVYNMYKDTFDFVRRNGQMVFYSPGSTQAVAEDIGDEAAKSSGWVYHGLDHALPKKPYPELDIEYMKEIVGFGGRYVVTSVGANKRVKAFPDLIYTAAEVKKLGGGNNIIFYVHTNADAPLTGAFSGHHLRQLARYYGVDDIVMFKPVSNAQTTGFEWKGIPYDSGLSMADQLREYVRVAREPQTPEARGNLFASFSYNDIAAISDLYLDLSYIEGWGLPIGEFMARGVPALGVQDYHIRDEIYAEARMDIPMLPERMWETYHSGARMAKADPKVVAKILIELSYEKIDNSSSIALAKSFRWDDAAKKMVALIQEQL